MTPARRTSSVVVTDERESSKRQRDKRQEVLTVNPGGIEGSDRGSDARIGCVVGDDHAALRKGVASYLRAEAGIAVIGEAADGGELLELVARRRPDVAIVDLRMEQIDGLEICRRLHAAGPEPRVVIYSGFSEAELVEEALEAGANGYVLKSGPPLDLVRAVTVAMTDRVYLDGTLGAALVERRAQATRRVLSEREEEVLQLLAAGLTTGQAAEQMFLAPTTVRSYAESAMHKLGARNRVQAVADGLRRQLIN
jgi:DNA-binding NarL/FixJ family response regulator